MKRKYVKDYVADETLEGGYRYTGVYYVDGVTEQQRKKLGSIHLLIAVLQVAIVLGSIMIDCLGNRTIYVVIPMECTLFCSMSLGMGAYTFLKCHNRMELRQYEGSYQRMVQSAAVAFFLNVGSLVGQIYVIYKGYSLSGQLNEYLLLGAITVVTLINGLEWKVQRKMIADVSKEGH